jgi:hypothetical protein
MACTVAERRPIPFWASRRGMRCWSGAVRWNVAAADSMITTSFVASLLRKGRNGADQEYCEQSSKLFHLLIPLSVCHY